MQRQSQFLPQHLVRGISPTRSCFSLLVSLITLALATSVADATPPRAPDQEVACEILVAGGGLAGAASAYESLLAGRTVCITDITDWIGGQISSQGTSALDERPTQRQQLFYPQGYLEFRESIRRKYGRLNPGQCWVSESCFMPYDGHKLLFDQLERAARRGKGTLKWYPNTVIKELDISPGTEGGEQIQSAIAIQIEPAPGQPPVNAEPLSQILEDAYRYENSARFHKTLVRFVPMTGDRNSQNGNNVAQPAQWYVIDATETGELIGLADIPYRLGVDPRSPLEPSSSNAEGNPYCTQGFTYTFAMQATKDPQQHVKPAFYDRYAPYYSYELERLANFNLVYTYRRIWSEKYQKTLPSNPREYPINPGDISMQNWTWGNDYRPGTAQDNLIYTRQQLQSSGQLQPGGWMGGLRTETLQAGEEHAIGFFYWLVQGTTDSQLGDGVKQPNPNHRYLSGLDSPMGTANGLSKYPYMREGRRIIGRPGWGHPDGFTVWEIDISRADYSDEFYRTSLLPEEYRRLWESLSGLQTLEAIGQRPNLEGRPSRSRSTIFPDSVGIAHYAIDFHPCMTLSPPEAPGNTELEGERRGAGTAYPFQIPLRALIPQRIDNLLIAGKSIATSHIAAAAYRVHSFEWSSGVAAGLTADFSLEKGILPYQLVDNLPQREPQLEELQTRLVDSGNPIAFPNTSIFNNTWENWK
ncbi:FAD-dependent oxidoreductase [Laspinema palackyanum]|uniref:FAD-dependent oxidoreductase n=1 Tax=Laspinema palackyanum TaxID=3231601 RepID=UPI00345D99D4|nr:FAD-dependent oxidoreductase [Laspinema sp. D2c]